MKKELSFINGHLLAQQLCLKKNGKFSGTCASQSPFLNKEGEACGICGATAEEKCKNEEA